MTESAVAAIASPDEYGRLPLDLGFDFPIAGATFSQVNVGAYLTPTDR